MIIIMIIHLWYILCLILKWDDLIFIDLKTLNLNLYLELQFKIQLNWISFVIYLNCHELSITILKHTI